MSGLLLFVTYRLYLVWGRNKDCFLFGFKGDSVWTSEHNAGPLNGVLCGRKPLVARPRFFFQLRFVGGLACLKGVQIGALWVQV